MKIGFIGLGHMGMPMAQRLLQAGHEVVAWNRTEEKVQDLVRQGARQAQSPAEAARSGIVITMLSDDEATDRVVSGDSGILIGLPRDGVHIAMSTISMGKSQDLQQAHEQKGQVYVAAPVFGRPDAATAGKLFIVAAGNLQALSRCGDLWDAMGQKTFTIQTGEPWRAHLIKIAGNFMLQSGILALAEAMALTRKAGMDPNEFLEIMTGSLFSAPFYKGYGSMIAGERYEQPAGFKLKLALKDNRLALEAADAMGVPLFLGSLLHDLMLSGIGRGYENLDMSAIGKIASDNAGIGKD